MKARFHLLLCAAMTTCAYAEFTNLHFESYSGSGPDILPGWEVTPGYQLELNDMPLVTSGVGLISDGYFNVIEGTYSAFMVAGLNEAGTGYQTVSLWQTAIVPSAAAYISIDTAGISPANVNYSFTLGGIDLLQSTPVLIPGGDWQDFYRYTTSIQSLAGQSGTLQFTVTYNGPMQDVGWYHRIDNIQFQSISEPSTLWLVCSGAFSIPILRKIRSTRRCTPTRHKWREGER